MKKNVAGYVYIFSLGFNNLYKIGRSKNWQRRLREYKTGNPQMKSVCVCEFPDANRIEWYMRFINSRYRYKRHEVNEIFKFSQAKLTEAINHLNFFAEHGLFSDWRRKYAEL